jgi:hypothetical protein
MVEMDQQNDLSKVALKYAEFVRISSKILKDIMTLQDTETCFRRPFVFKQESYDYVYVSA